MSLVYVTWTRSLVVAISLISSAGCWNDASPTIAAEHRSPIADSAVARQRGSLRLMIPESGIHDFGTVIEGDECEYTFILENATSVPATVSQVKAGCSCTAVANTMTCGGSAARPYELNTPLHPGCALELTAKLDSRGKNGPIDSTLTIISADDSPTTILHLRATVVPQFVVTPSSLEFGTHYYQSRKRASVVISSLAFPRFSLVPDANSRNPGITAVVTPMSDIQDGLASRWSVDVELGPGVPQNRLLYIPLRLLVTLPGTDKEARTVLIPVKARVVGDVDTAPESLSFGLIPPLATVSRACRILSLDDRPLARITEADLTIELHTDSIRPEDVAITIAEIVPFIEYELQVAVRPSGAGDRKAFRGEVQIKTGHPSIPIVQLPFFGLRSGDGTTDSSVLGSAVPAAHISNTR